MSRLDVDRPEPADLAFVRTGIPGMYTFWWRNDQMAARDYPHGRNNTRWWDTGDDDGCPPRAWEHLMSLPDPQLVTFAEQGELLTSEEHQAMQLTADLWNLLNRIVGQGRSRAGDLGEICTHIHNLQHAILAQAAARAYPERYRLLGGTIIATSDTSPLCGWCAAMPGELHRIPCPKARP